MDVSSHDLRNLGKLRSPFLTGFSFYNSFHPFKFKCLIKSQNFKADLKFLVGKSSKTWTNTGVLRVGEVVRVCFMTILVGRCIVTDQTEISSLRAGASVNLLSFGEGRHFKEVCLEGSAVGFTACII